MKTQAGSKMQAQVVASTGFREDELLVATRVPQPPGPQELPMAASGPVEFVQAGPVRVLEPVAPHRGPPQVEATAGICAVLRALEQAPTSVANGPHPGLNLAQELTRGTRGPAELVLRSRPTLGEGIRELIRLAPALGVQVELSLEITGALATLELRKPGSPTGFGSTGNVFLAATALQLLRELAGGAVKPLAVWFAHAAPDELDGLRSFFGCHALSFGGMGSGLAFDARLLDTVLDATEAAPAERIQALTAQVPPPTAGEIELEQIREKVQSAAPQGGAALVCVAQMLQTSTRTLQRRLAERGMSFQELLDTERLRLARRLLAEPGLSLQEVAQRLGYSRLPAFVRSFKRWTGMTPGRFRQLALGAGRGSAAGNP